MKSDQHPALVAPTPSSGEGSMGLAMIAARSGQTGGGARHMGSEGANREIGGVGEKGHYGEKT